VLSRVRLTGAPAALALAILAAPAMAAWAPAQDLGESRAPSALAGAPADVAIDRRGDATVLWTRCDAQSTCQALVADHPAGGAWSAPRALGDGVAGTTRLATTATGDTIAAWAAGDGVHAAVRPVGGSWGVTQTIALPPPEACCFPPGAGRPAVAFDAKGDAMLAWVVGYTNQASIFPRGPYGGHSLLFASRRLPDGGWEPARIVARTTFDPPFSGTLLGGFRLALDQNGNALALWEQGTSLFAAFEAPGGEWTATDPPAVGGDLLALTADASGAAVAAWWTTDAPATLGVARRPSGGVWSPPESAGAFPGLFVDFALDARGTLVGVVGYGAVAALSKPIGGEVTPFTTIRAVGGGRFSDEPALALAADGSGVAVWHEIVQGLDATGTVPVNAFGVTAAVRASDGTWGPQEFVVGPGPPNTPIAEAPAVAAGVGGHGAAAWLGANDQVQAALLDATPPTLGAVGVPEEAVAGTPVALSAAPADDFSGLGGPPAWDLGDGATATGTALTHAWSAPGTYTVAVTVADAAGNLGRVERRIVVASRPPAPDAATGAARAVCATRAVLTGSIDGHGLAATARFTYGSRSTNRSTPSRAVAAGTTRQGVRESVQGLRPGTRYVVRAVAESSGGTTSGAVRSFRTPPARLGPWRSAPRAVPRGYRLVRRAAGGRVRYVARARAC
jgi:PKD domain-containing protein